MTNYIWKGAIVVIGIIAIAGLFFPRQTMQLAGSVGGKLIEQYDPYVRYNGGTNTALPIQTSSNITGTSLSGVFSWAGTMVSTATLAVNNFVVSVVGWSLTLSTANGNSQTLGVTAFCGAATTITPITSTTTLTITLPSATSSAAACNGGNAVALGSFSTQLITNESSNVLTFATTSGEVKGQGVQFDFASSTVFTNAAASPGYPFTSTGLAVPASTTVEMIGQFSGTSTANAILRIHVIYFQHNLSL